MLCLDVSFWNYPPTQDSGQPPGFVLFEFPTNLHFVTGILGGGVDRKLYPLLG